MHTSTNLPYRDLPDPFLTLSFGGQSQKRPPSVDIIFYVLGNRRRRILFELLCQREHPIEELVDITSGSYQAVRKQLRILEAHGFITSFREGRYRYYYSCINSLACIEFWAKAHKNMISRFN